MFYKRHGWIAGSILLILSMILAACAPAGQVVAGRGGSRPGGDPEPAAESPAQPPDALQSPEAFGEVLLAALAARDAGQIQALMGDEPFLYGWWRGEMMDVPPADAVQDLLRDQLGEGSRPAVVEGVDLAALMGGTDPLSLPRPEAGVTDTLLVSGWGAGGRDEALLFLARSPEGSFSWRGTLLFLGGITSQAAGGAQEYTNHDFGFSLFYPAGYEVQSLFYHEILFLAPQGTQGHRERAFLQVEEAGDLPAEWFAERVREDNLSINPAISTTVMGIEGEVAYILGRLPGQDLNRQVFIVHKGILYHLTFMPDDPQAGEAYQQMETLYAAIINTLHFLPERRETAPVTSVSNMIHRIEQAVESRSEDDILRTFGDEFLFLYWLAPGVTREPYGRNEALQIVLDSHLSQAPDLVFQNSLGWPDVPGSPEAFTGFFPGETVMPVLVRGWGPQGSDEAVVIIARRMDGSMFWRGVLAAQGAFAP